MKKLKQAIREAIPFLIFVAAWFAITSFFGWTDTWLSRIDLLEPETLVLLGIPALLTLGAIIGKLFEK